MINDELVSIQNLGKKYGHFTAVDDMTFSVKRGEIFALLGPNGAGKTTTIRMLMGILQPSQGTAKIDNMDCFENRAEVMKQVGYMPDDPVFYDYMRGREIIRFCGQMHGLSSDDIENRSQLIIDRLGLEDDLEEYANNYSKGMKKKLAAVIAFIHDPKLVILDEPTNGLDPYATRTFHEMILERVEQGTSVLFSTHLLNQAEKLCTDVGIMAKGKLAAIGKIDELRDKTSADNTLEEVFFQITSDEDPEGA